MKLLLILPFLQIAFLSSSAFSDDDHEPKTFSENTAIVEVQDHGKKFKLSVKATKALNLKFDEIKFLTNDSFEIPSTALVSFGESLGVFVVRDGWYELILVKTSSQKKSTIKISSTQLKKSDQIVVSGVPLLRVAHLEASGEGGEGH